ncbi:uncharacterized protein LOC141984040 [Natator depressus]|uniref:uncharacterized protein LOC141984040 n=1 Tax=Natator depressus TaxID=27790 RepID=UPI003EBE4EBE
MKAAAHVSSANNFPGESGFVGVCSLLDSEGARAPLGHGLAGGRKPVAQWTVPEVCAWLSSGALGAQGPLVQAARSHAISGRALLRLTEGTLQRMGVAPGCLRRQLLQEALQLRIQQEVQELLDIADGPSQLLISLIPPPARLLNLTPLARSPHHTNVLHSLLSKGYPPHPDPTGLSTNGPISLPARSSSSAVYHHRPKFLSSNPILRPPAPARPQSTDTALPSLQ